MQKLKSIVFVAGVMLLILAAVVGYISIEELSAMPSADSYKDRGVYTFVPYEVASQQVKKHQCRQPGPAYAPHQNNLHCLLS